jgi:hypothetical protein
VAVLFSGGVPQLGDRLYKLLYLDLVRATAFCHCQFDLQTPSVDCYCTKTITNSPFVSVTYFTSNVSYWKSCFASGRYCDRAPSYNSAIINYTSFPALYDASIGKQLPTFRSTVIQLHGQATQDFPALLFDCLILKMEGTRFPRNVGNYSSFGPV